MILNKKKGYGLYFEPSKSTSGQRFFSDLHNELKYKIVPISDHPEAILFNVSAPLKQIIKAKILGQIIILRIDSLYFDELSKEFIENLNLPFRIIISFLSRFRIFRNSLTEFANFVEQNYSSFARILLSDFLIYQSEFSREIHQKYFPKKPNIVIVNGTIPKFNKPVEFFNGPCKVIKLITTYDGYRPSKRIYDIVNFVRWARLEKDVSIELIIIGYKEEEPKCTNGKIKKKIKNSSFIKTIPRFTDYNEDLQNIMYSSHIYISFSYRDACPNAIIEAMSFGLPVIGISSGGVPDIVGNSGSLIPNKDFENGFFSPHRFTCNFPSINYNLVLEELKKLSSKLPTFKEKVRNRFLDDLDISIVADRYDIAIQEFIKNSR